MKKHNLILLMILILAAFLRFFNLSANPPSLNWDEVSHGYNAYSILKTGKDEWVEFPITNFRAYGDYPLPLYMYLAIPTISLFGLNEFSIRLPSAIFGTLLLLVSFFLTKLLLKNQVLALLAALLTALSPWSILTSRQVLQATPAIFFLSLGILIFLYRSHFKYLPIVGTAIIGLSTLSYHNTRILAPLILFFLIFITRKFFLNDKKILIITLLIAIIFTFISTRAVLSGEGAARATWVGILDQGAINNINQSRAALKLPDPLPKLIYNKVTYFISKAASNYIGYFNPQFLGFEGGTHYQFSIPGHGILYPIELPLFYLGLIVLLFKFMSHSLEKKFLLIWILLAPIPAAITRDAYHVVRATTMLPVVYIVTVLGLGLIINHLENKVLYKKIFIGGFIVILLIFALRYNYNLHVTYPRDYSFAWQYGYKQVVQFIKKHYNDYDQIIMTKKYGEPHEFVLFYLSWDPLKYQKDSNLIRFFKSDWYWVDHFDKFYFVNDWEIPKENGRWSVNWRMESGKLVPVGKKTLLITSPGNYPSYGKMIKSINFLDGSRVFDIVEFERLQ